jgi:NADPH:quinone reductase-like Zn-dependent oxidoreductase
MHGAYVFLTSSSDAKLERGKELGADSLINYKSVPDWNKEILERTDGIGVDHVVETAGDLERSIRCLRVGGLVSAIGYAGQLDLEAGLPSAWTYTTPIIPVLVKNARLQGLSCAPRESYERMYRAMAAAELRPAVDRVFRFEESHRAYRYLMSGSHVGKVCIEVGEEP